MGIADMNLECLIDNHQSSITDTHSCSTAATDIQKFIGEISWTFYES